jgi:hypothetical protein
VDGSGSGLIQNIIPEFAWREAGEAWKNLSHVQAAILFGYSPNTRAETKLQGIIFEKSVGPIVTDGTYVDP